jgi:hypothetical protein
LATDEAANGRFFLPANVIAPLSLNTAHFA